MDCIYCGTKTSVTNSRPQKRLRQVWRRRHCPKCNAIFTTLEAVDFSTSLVVTYKGGKLQPFSRDQLFLSVIKVCGHRKTAQKDASGLTNTILSRLYPLITNGSIETDSIAKTAHSVLKRFDKASSVQYAAYHTNALG
ncbi:MAG: hypothetical protein ABI220_04840 [Candidatus Saccharimonadales bacterium]